MVLGTQRSHSLSGCCKRLATWSPLRVPMFDAMAVQLNGDELSCLVTSKLRRASSAVLQRPPCFRYGAMTVSMTPSSTSPITASSSIAPAPVCKPIHRCTLVRTRPSWSLSCPLCQFASVVFAKPKCLDTDSGARCIRAMTTANSALSWRSVCAPGLACHARGEGWFVCSSLARRTACRFASD